MGTLKKKKCKYCRTLFIPDPRNANRQGYCSLPECRKASKRASQRRWLRKPENRDHFRGHVNVLRVQQWREKHPGYWKKSKDALQDSLNVTGGVKVPINGRYKKPRIKERFLAAKGIV
jgi:hypothetical protein